MEIQNCPKHDIHDGHHNSHLEDLLLLAHLEICWPGALLQVSLCHGLLTTVHPSSVCPSVTLHFRHLHQNPVHDGHHGGHLGNLQLLSASNSKWNGMETLRKASGQHGDLELLKWFSSYIQDGHHSSRLKNMQITICYRTVSLIELKRDGRHWGVMEIQNC